MKNDWFIPPSDFLANLSIQDRKALLEVGTVSEYKKGNYVFQKGDPGDNVYILASGRAKISQLSSTGKEMILWFCLSGEIFGLAELPRAGQREVFAQVCSDAVVYSFRREDFNRFLLEHPQAAMQIIDLLSCRMRVLGHMWMTLAADDVASRIIKLILRLGARLSNNQSTGMRFEFPLTHQEIADMIGSSRQTVTTVLGELKRKGVIKMEQHHICIESTAALESMISNITNSDTSAGMH
ncbi:MAG: Crp/Fnr family transcriptional regulator [Granulosicoccaceae bacterium]|jgi:CRP/FNR family transcriptional regulator